MNFNSLDKSAIKHASDQRELFINEGVYSADTINRLPPSVPMTYSDILLRIRLEMVRSYAKHLSVLDVCCATGQHLMDFAGEAQTCTGIDFSLPYLQKAGEYKNTKDLKNTYYACSDARQLPFRANSFDVAYSFSSLYVIPGVNDVISEIARVLKPGGKCVLDLGNLYSLNVIVINAYHKELGWAQHYAISVATMKRMIHQVGLRIVEHRAFQILPLWGGDRPRWLKVFLLPVWTQVLSRQVKAKTLDEWISNLPVFKSFAFRHVFLCEKM